VTAEELASEQGGYSLLRFIADTLTLARMGIAFIIVLLGFTFGEPALPTAIILVLIGWLTDTVDGPIARRSGSRPTWVAAVDVPADLALVFSFFLFLVVSGLYPLIPALAIAAAGGIIVLIRPTYDVVQMVTAPFFALPIVLSFLAGWLVGTIYVAFITFMIIFRWKRLKGYANDARSEASLLERGDD
jgi:phosphatidylglycerophosphate synthase